MCLCVSVNGPVLRAYCHPWHSVRSECVPRWLVLPESAGFSCFHISGDHDVNESHDHCISWGALIIQQLSVSVEFSFWSIRCKVCWRTCFQTWHLLRWNLTLEQLRSGFRMSPNRTTKWSLSFDDFISCLSWLVLSTIMLVCWFLSYCCQMRSSERWVWSCLPLVYSIWYCDCSLRVSVSLVCGSNFNNISSPQRHSTCEMIRSSQRGRNLQKISIKSRVVLHCAGGAPDCLRCLTACPAPGELCRGLSFKIFSKNNTVTLSFLFNKYCLIIE